MMTCRWKCHGQQSINPKTSKDVLQLDVRMPLKDGWRFIYFRLKSWDSSTLGRWCGRGRSLFLSSSSFICHVLVTVGRLSAIIYETLSEKFSSGSLPLRTSGLPSSVLPTWCLKNSLPCLFPFLLCGFFLQLPCVGLIHLTHHCHLNKAIIIKRLYLIIYLSSWYLHAYARNDAQLKAITNLPPRSSCNWCQQHRSTPLTVCMWRGPHSKYIRIGRQLEELLDIWKHPV